MNVYEMPDNMEKSKEEHIYENRKSEKNEQVNKSCGKRKFDVIKLVELAIYGAMVAGLVGISVAIVYGNGQGSCSAKLDEMATEMSGLKQAVAQMKAPVVSAFTVSDAAVMETSTIIRFTNIIYDAGSDYNTSSGHFTCKHPGIYSFTVTLTFSYHDHINAQCILYKNTTKIWTVSMNAEMMMAIVEETPISGSATVHLNKGDTIYIAGCRPQELVSAFTVSDAAVMETSTIIRFTNIIYDAGSDYNTSSGHFTCKHPGIYSFTVILTFSHHELINAQCILYKNTTKIWTVSMNAEMMMAIVEETPISGSATVHLNKGDTIYIAGCRPQERSSFLTGFLISSFRLTHMYRSGSLPRLCVLSPNLCPALCNIARSSFVNSALKCRSFWSSYIEC